jgi:phage replication-related protein YjqB (UPF0714/DUF867 family)
MKFINIILSVSAAFAFTDYFKYVKDMYPQLKIGKDQDITEVRLPIHPSQVTEKDGIQVLSVAIHGGKIESETDKFAYKLYENVKDSKKKSMLYSFISNIGLNKSGKVLTKRCTTINCCKRIKYIDKKLSYNPYFGDGSECKSFGKKPVEECNSEKVCYPNAAHVTSENFMTNKLSEILKDRYPVSFHGHRNRYDKNGKLVHIILGGLSNQKFKLAELYHNWSGKSISVAVCKDAKNCRTYDPAKSFDQRAEVDASHITGVSTKNFVNRGKNNCGLQIELSLAFTNSTLTNEAHWDSLIQSIIKTLPKNDTEICQPKSYIHHIKYFAFRYFNEHFYTMT